LLTSRHERGERARVAPLSCLPRALALTGLQARILELLAARGPGKTICPSDVLPADEKQNAARMEEVREAARGLVARGEIVITQHGEVVDPDRLRGPIRLRLK